jgi:hypothetical protein
MGLPLLHGLQQRCLSGADLGEEGDQEEEEVLEAEVALELQEFHFLLRPLGHWPCPW